MSPIADDMKNIRDADGFFRNERGLKDMTLLLGFIAMILGALVLISGLVGFWLLRAEAMTLIQVGAGLVLSSAGLQAWEARLERPRGGSNE